VSRRLGIGVVVNIEQLIEGNGEAGPRRNFSLDLRLFYA
jgi:hypothetical protein